MGLFGMNNNQWGNTLTDPAGVANGKQDPGGLFNSKTPYSVGDSGIQYPGYQQTYDPSTMSDTAELNKISPQYSQGFNELRSQALNQGPSTWLNMSQQHNQMQLDDAMNQAQQTSAGKTAAGESALAAGGGLSSGARERLQEGGGQNLMSMDQGLQRTGAEQNLGLEATDQGNKIGQLNNLVSDENTKQGQWNQAFQSDVGNEMQNTSQNNAYNMNLYNTQMQTWAAAQQANATANSGKK